MANVKIKSKLTNESESKQTVPVKIFKITDIPDVMEKKRLVSVSTFHAKMVQ